MENQMTTSQLTSVKEAAIASLTAWNEFIKGAASLEGPQGEVFDLEKPIPNLPVTIKQLELKLAGVITLITSVSEIEKLDLIPDLLLADVTTKVSTLKTIVEKFPAAIAALEKDNPIVSVDVTAMTAANQKGQQVALVPLLGEIYPAIQALLTPLFQLREMAGVAKSGGAPDLHISEINLVRSAQSRAYGDLERLRRAISNSRDAVDKINSEAKVAYGEIDASKTKAVDSIKKIEEVTAKSAELITTVNAAITSAGTLNQQVTAYQQTFTDFQNKLDGQKQQIEKGQKDWTSMLAEVKKTHDEVSRLQERSREVLGEATMSGLSENFAREMKSARWGVLRAQFAFYFAIVFLLLSAGIVLNAFPALERQGWVHGVVFNPPAGVDNWTLSVLYLGNIISKAIFLAPAVLFLAFTARRYGEVFQLKKLYTYKYTIASSLPGFKIEAPDYAEAITAMAFEKLLVNTDEHSDKEAKNPEGGSTFLQKIIEPAVKKIIDKMSDLPKKP
jgi:flagellar biosynthesis chaperone FliJ